MHHPPQSSVPKRGRQEESANLCSDGGDEVAPSEMWATGSKVVVLDPSGKWHAAAVVDERYLRGLRGREVRVHYEVPGLVPTEHTEWLSVGGNRLRAAGGKLDPSKWGAAAPTAAAAPRTAHSSAEPSPHPISELQLPPPPPLPPPLPPPRSWVVMGDAADEAPPLPPSRPPSLPPSHNEDEAAAAVAAAEEEEGEEEEVLVVAEDEEVDEAASATNLEQDGGGSSEPAGPPTPAYGGSPSEAGPPTPAYGGTPHDTVVGQLLFAGVKEEASSGTASATAPATGPAADVADVTGATAQAGSPHAIGVGSAAAAETRALGTLDVFGAYVPLPAGATYTGGTTKVLGKGTAVHEVMHGQGAPRRASCSA